MRTIKVSEGVWQAIASKGKFGETEDDVLRRVFKLPPDSSTEGANTSPDIPRGGQLRKSFAKQRMSSYIQSNNLHVSFQDGSSDSWTLPNRSDKNGIRTVRDKAVAFAKENKATIGQINAVKKALTDAGYHLTK